jgi:hypothetical protein
MDVGCLFCLVVTSRGNADEGRWPLGASRPFGRQQVIRSDEVAKGRSTGSDFDIISKCNGTSHSSARGQHQEVIPFSQNMLKKFGFTSVLPQKISS